MLRSLSRVAMRPRPSAPVGLSANSWMLQLLPLRSISTIRPPASSPGITSVHSCRDRLLCRSGCALPLRPFSAGGTAGKKPLSQEEVRNRLDEFQELFVEARLCIEDCSDAVDTTYFDEEADAAREAVDEAVVAFEALLGDLDEEERGRVTRQNGLKVEQLKGELELVINGGH